MMTLKNTFNTTKTLSILLLSILCIACNNKAEKTLVKPVEETVKTITAAPTKALANSSSKYTSRMSKSDKKKFYDSDNNLVYEIKYKSGSFKLRTATSTLLWKVKFYDEKIKISDNEGNNNPFEIKLIDTHDAKLVRGETKIARTHYDYNTKTQSIEASGPSKPLSYTNVSYSPSLLISAINAIPQDQQQIIIKELIEKGY